MPTRVLPLALALCLVLATAAFAEPKAPSLSPKELEARQTSGNALVVIDVRSAEEFAAGHIPGAVNIPYEEVADRIDEVDAPHGVALYCRIGPRARRGEAALLAKGYGPVFHLEGGLTAWQLAGLPVEWPD